MARGLVLARERFRVKTPFLLFGFVMPSFNLPPMSTLYNCVFFLSLASLVLGQASSSDQINHGMDMNMDLGMSLASGSMLPYLHFAASDILWFEGWVPQNKGAIGGACVGLFMLALFDRWLSAIRSTAENHWAQDARIGLANNLNTSGKASIISRLPAMRMAPPFLAANDISRGLVYGAQTLLGYAFMLATMTFNGGFLLSITAGLGVGEMLYGRYSHRSNGY